jgi:hypothetical protein
MPEHPFTVAGPAVMAENAPEILPIPTEAAPLTVWVHEFQREWFIYDAGLRKREKLEFTGCNMVGSEVNCNTEGDAADTIKITNSDLNIVDYKGNEQLLLGLVIFPLLLVEGAEHGLVGP